MNDEQTEPKPSTGLLLGPARANAIRHGCELYHVSALGDVFMLTPCESNDDCADSVHAVMTLERSEMEAKMAERARKQTFVDEMKGVL